MQTVFTYGSRKSAVTPRTILFGAFDINYQYHVYAAFGKIPVMPSDAAALVSSGNIEAVKAALSRSVKYESDVRSFYDRELGNTNSPGKSDRIRTHRRDVTTPTLESIAILKSGLATLMANVVAEHNSKQSDFNPETGKNLTTAEKQAIMDKLLEKNNSVAEGFDASKLILPIGAGLAALFFLKGH